ncbi:SEC-C metal-binding domain-containing protein [Anaerolineales bacterium HSG24]|nr:SEC-C metal-binding domain-containing protein [Anaerolineales bacterium HSG24]
MLKKFINMIMGDPHKKEIKRYIPVVDKVNELADEMQQKSDEELQTMMAEFREEIQIETADLKAEIAELKQDVVKLDRQERQKVQVQIEQQEKDLLNLEKELLADMQVDVFAAVREASRRTIGLIHYDVQIVGGAILHEGKVVEMRTGEGKTLVATMPTALNALTGWGAHVITVNDYLAKRDCQWMGPVYHILGFSVAVIQSAGGGGVDKASFRYNPDYQSNDDRFQFLEPITRQQAYACDITYGTNNEYGFDYLRDNMVTDLKKVAQRERHYAIIDEVDNILVDEARTPLIISGQAEESSEQYRQFSQLVRPLKPSSKASVDDEEAEPDGDYVIDAKARIVYLTEQGIEKIERALGVENIYEGDTADLTPYLDNALRAHALFKNDIDYVVSDGQVVIVDEFTGRLMEGRRYSEGLHQAIEAKEGVNVQNESFTWATITFQNFFRMYNKLAGMTGTAETEAEEFSETYKIEVTILPTNIEYRSLQGELDKRSHKKNGAELVTYHSPDGKIFYKRADYPDVIYKNPRVKFQAVVEELKACQDAGQPVLVGTIAIETSEYLAKQLERAGVKHEVLNAKNHEREAEIITQAGRPGRVTIATNMAGRGVDILLGGNPEGLARDELRRGGRDLTEIAAEEWEKTRKKWAAVVAKDRETVLELGGLYVIGTERHDARRIDNQLRGRAGRQGDPGASRFFVSLEDDLMMRFGGQTVSNMMERFRLEEDTPLEVSVVSRAIENAQTKVEGHNFDIRKHLIKYDDVINQQREVIYAERKRILNNPDISHVIWAMLEDHISSLVHIFTASEDPEEWDLVALMSEFRIIVPLEATMVSRRWVDMDPEEIEEDIMSIAEEKYDLLEEDLGEEVMRRVEKSIMLQSTDMLWVRHLTALDSLRQGIGLRAYGQQDPLVAYKREGFEMYNQLRDAIKERIVRRMFHVRIAPPEAPKPKNVQAIHRDANANADADNEERSKTTETTPGATRQAQQPIRVQKTLSRNAICWCGSGKKYKSCHMKTDKLTGNGATRKTTSLKKKRKEKARR